MITIVDYGLGNVQAFTNVFKRLKGLARIDRVIFQNNSPLYI